MRIKRLHYISGLLISVFIGLHLLNHFYGLWGPEKHIALMHALRLFYRHPFVETILLSAVLLQIISGLRLFGLKRKLTVTAFDRLQIWTGLYLAFFLLVHVGAVFVGRLYLHLDTNFYFGVAGLNTFPFNLFFIPYYALGIVSVFGHLASVHATKMNVTIAGLTPKVQGVAVLVFGLCVTAVLFYGLTNHFRGVALPKEYRVLVGK